MIDDRRVVRLLAALRSEAELRPVVEAYEHRREERGARFGKNGLEAPNGKLFALFTQGTLVVKLPKERVAALVSAGLGERFDPGHGRLMKEWLAITSRKASWVDLVKQAYAFVTR